MNQHLHLVTLGVREYQASKKFYTEILGWKPSSSSSDDTTFFQAGGVILSIYQREKLAEDALVDPEGKGFGEGTIPISLTQIEIAGRWLTIRSFHSRKTGI